MLARSSLSAQIVGVSRLREAGAPGQSTARLPAAKIAANYWTQCKSQICPGEPNAYGTFGNANPPLSKKLCAPQYASRLNARAYCALICRRGLEQAFHRAQGETGEPTPAVSLGSEAGPSQHTQTAKVCCAT